MSSEPTSLPTIGMIADPQTSDDTGRDGPIYPASLDCNDLAETFRIDVVAAFHIAHDPYADAAQPLGAGICRLSQSTAWPRPRYGRHLGELAAPHQTHSAHYVGQPRSG
jgi:hypothetical protein